MSIITRILLELQDITAGQDDDEVSELLDNMSPAQPWAEPPPNPPLAPDADPIAAGEDSQARHDEAQRVQTSAAYPSDHPPQDPLEPAFLEPEPAAGYVISAIQLLTPQEIIDQQAAQQQLQQQAVGLLPNLNLPSQGLARQQQGVPGPLNPPPPHSPPPPPPPPFPPPTHLPPLLTCHRPSPPQCISRAALLHSPPSRHLALA